MTRINPATDDRPSPIAYDNTGRPELPANHDIETAICGTLIAHPAAWRDVAGVIDDTDFQDPNLRMVFQAVSRLIEQRRTPTLALMVEQYRGVDPEVIRSYLQSIGGFSNPMAIADYVQTIRELSDRRQIIDAATRAITEAQGGIDDTSAAEIRAELVGDMTSSGADESGLVRVGTLAAGIAERVRTGAMAQPMSTGLVQLDMVMDGGVYPCRSYGFAARHKRGKSVLLSTIANGMTAGHHPVPTLYISLEMPAEDITARMMANALEVRTGALIRMTAGSNEEMARRAADVADAFNARPLWLCRRPRATFRQINGLIVRASMALGVKVVIVDYIQLIGGRERSQSTADHLDNVAQGLSDAARLNGVALIVAAQTNQQDNVRGGEGMLNAFDQVYNLHRVDDPEESMNPLAWLEMMATRYTESRNVGSKKYPAFELDPNGPMFKEIIYGPRA